MDENITSSGSFEFFAFILQFSKHIKVLEIKCIGIADQDNEDE